MRIEQLTFTRFIAALSIVVFHYGQNVFPFNLNIGSFLFKQAYVGVSYFFILSGFVMIIAYGNKNKIAYGDYIKRRFARIYPVYFLAIVILFIYLLAFKQPIDYKGLFLNFTMTQSWFPGYALSFNTPGWSLAVEMFFYISFPLLFNLFYKKYSLNKLILPILLVFIVSQLALHSLTSQSFYQGYPSKSHDFIFYFPLMHFSEFLIGNLAGLFFIKGIKKRNYDLLIIGLIIILYFWLKFNSTFNFHNGMLAFVFVPLIVLISSNNGILTNVSKGKIFVFLGEISYGIYILQKPIYAWVNDIMYYFNIGNPTRNFYAALFTLIIFSAVSYKLIEGPLRRKINNMHSTIFYKKQILK